MAASDAFLDLEEHILVPFISSNISARAAVVVVLDCCRSFHAQQFAHAPATTMRLTSGSGNAMMPTHVIMPLTYSFLFRKKINHRNFYRVDMCTWTHGHRWVICKSVLRPTYEPLRNWQNVPRHDALNRHKNERKPTAMLHLRTSRTP